jgi:hypothetical protein
MPPAVVKTVKDLIFWQYAKIIAASSGIGKYDYGFVMAKSKQLRQAWKQPSTACPGSRKASTSNSLSKSLRKMTSWKQTKISWLLLFAQSAI